ncbi:MAG: arginine--tRNA ligase [Clostridiales bacterium]|nr:arginine--tRNA ligase [Clostridiales bacterium]
MDTKQAIIAALQPFAQSDEAALQDWLETPKDANMGDLCLPCFRLAKILRKNPNSIAQDLQAVLPTIAGVAKVEAVGGYLNFCYDKTDFAAKLLEKVLTEKERYGAADIGQGRNVCVEFSSINIAKPFHIGHLPSTAIGNSLYRIYNFLGYNAIGINHLGDWGTQFGKMIVAYKLWGDRPVTEYSVRELVALYVRYHEEAEKQPELNLDDQARAAFKQIEAGDPDAIALWKEFVAVSMNEAARVYQRLGVHFDSFAGESFYEDKMPTVIAELRGKGILKTDQGAEIVDLSDYNMPPCIILKKDGSTIYATRDLAAACYRKETYDFVRSLYVVAYQQDLHFRQFFKVLELMDKEWMKDCEHVNFGMVSMEDGTLKTRQGNVTYLDDVLDAAVAKARELMREKSPDLADVDAAAETVGVGALIWGVLYKNRIKDTSFSWAKALNFDGETGPYAQYTHARCCSVLRKAVGLDIGTPDYACLCDPHSAALLRAIAAFPAAIVAAAEKNEPYLVARAVMAVATAYNKFYYENRILGEVSCVCAARLLVTDAARITIANGLNLLGITAPERM